ncbi:hypothetical protein [Dyadobacter sp. BHUBP1]|uniref:hypothetical protein n=1 Tax=Dyadobacter sp. BHUBP1 TaxID=3424178 RepID=UPI003D34F90A
MKNEMILPAEAPALPFRETALLLKIWVRNHIFANALGLAVLHPFLAHYFTGPHDKVLTGPQLVMHNVSLVTFIVLLVIGQNRALQIRFSIGTFKGLGYFLLLVPAAFWLGYYTLYIPFDIIFMYATIGMINAGLVGSLLPKPGRWVWQCILSFLLAGIVGAACGIAAYFAGLKDAGGFVKDYGMWSLISITAAITYGSLTRRALERQLSETSKS